MQQVVYELVTFTYFYAIYQFIIFLSNLLYNVVVYLVQFC